MPDRRRRTAFRLPLPARAALLMRERQSSSPDSSPGSSPASGSPDSVSPSSTPDAPAKPADDNPFAAPPADRPDQPWQPRHPSGPDSGPDSGEGSGSGSGEGSGGRSSWGSQWSNKQPGRGNGGFGGRSSGNGPGGDGGASGPRWDPTDPTQRRARYALLGGMWSVFFALFEFSEIALLLGALSVYWAVSSLRAGPRSPSAADRTAVGGGSAPAAGTGGASPVTAGSGSGSGSQNGSRPQTTAAISGLVTALLALVIVITTFTVQLVYRDYYTCVNDSLTKVGTVACNDQLPKPLQPLFGVKE
ncbi:hypothetical protein B7C62_22685 [Kitasatospora albolonga]|uniref:Integral membrane protein n=1 Tax=Kitasatospora albolonga TaxID=68173 RepID=A0ABC8BWL3_9ACTN|nr:hypothetical protein B7C62_22685 [Kitasatospora albolonga]